MSHPHACASRARLETSRRSARFWLITRSRSCRRALGFLVQGDTLARSRPRSIEWRSAGMPSIPLVGASTCKKNLIRLSSLRTVVQLYILDPYSCTADFPVQFKRRRTAHSKSLINGTDTNSGETTIRARAPPRGAGAIARAKTLHACHWWQGSRDPARSIAGTPMH